MFIKDDSKDKIYQSARTGLKATYSVWIDQCSYIIEVLDYNGTKEDYFNQKIKEGYFIEVKNEM